MTPVRSTNSNFSVDVINPYRNTTLSPTRLKEKAMDLAKMSPRAQKSSSPDIIDIRQHVIEFDLTHDIDTMLRPAEGAKQMPTMLLYDEKGLQIFEEITYLEEYYLTNAEIEVLTNHAKEIVEHIQSGSMIVELGSGNLRKVSILLRALDDAGKSIDYYALDLSQKELERTLSDVPKFKNVVLRGLLGTYDDGLEWLKSGENASRPKCILSLGSSIGNFNRPEASAFLKNFASLLRATDCMIVGLDACNDGEKVYSAYNDSLGVTHRFVLNGLVNANRILNDNVFNLDDWRVIGEYVYDEDGGRHQAFYAPNKDLTIRGVKIEKDERVQVEQSLKYSRAKSQTLWKQAGLQEVGLWTANKELYNVHMLTKGEKLLGLHPSQYAASFVPTLEDWRGIWATWDTVTRGMIPRNELLNKPIKLRNACIFYLGHIPTFLDVQLSKATGEPLTEPQYYTKIFERGIDPDVDNPDHCHAHSEVPDEWPHVDEILGYQGQVRARVESLYASGSPPESRRIGRALWIGLEHEIMHLETLLYMLLQSDNRMDPPRTVKPEFARDASEAATNVVENEWFEIPEQTITVGLEDPEDNSGPDHYFGWDNEKPSRQVEVKAFSAKGRPVTNEEYATYLQGTNNTTLPASWTKKTYATNGTSNGETNGHKNEMVNGDATASGTLGNDFLEETMVRTVYGPVPFKHALHWPVFASYNELAGCASWMGGRIPTADEARSVYAHVNKRKLKEAENQDGRTVPAVNGHLANNGVQETPPLSRAVNGGSSNELFANLEGANVGFRHWHPVSVAASGNKLAGQGELGGVWEWTSSELVKHQGFEPMPLYPAYTADFFDTKHNIVLGGSWATHPRIAGRKTFVNWYQRSYPYAWIGARLVKDL